MSLYHITQLYLWFRLVDLNPVRSVLLMAATYVGPPHRVEDAGQIKWSVVVVEKFTEYIILIFII